MQVRPLVEALRSVRQYAVGIWWLTTVLAVLAVVAGGLFNALLLDAQLVLPAAIRLVLLLGLIGGLVVLVRWAWRVRPELSTEEAALLVEHRHPDLDNLLINSLQLAQQTPDAAQPIVDAVTDEARQAIRSISPATAVSKRTLSIAAVAAVIGLAGLIIHTSLSGATFGQGINRLLLPFADNTLTRIDEVSPGDVDVLIDDDVTVTAALSGRVLSNAQLLCTLADSRQVTLPMAAPADARPDRLTSTIERVQQNVRYRVIAGDAWSRWYEVRVHRRPAIEQITQTITPPKYVDADPVEQVGGSIRALTGSTVKLRVEASEPVREGWLVLNDGRREPLRIAANESGDQAASSVVVGALTVAKAGSYAVELTSVHGFANEPARYEIAPLADQPPQVTFVQPTESLAVSIDAKVVIEMQATDDQAVRELQLVRIERTGAAAKMPTAEPKVLTNWPAEDRRQMKLTRQTTVAVAELGLGPKKPITLQAVAYDYRPDGQPGTSERITLHLVEVPAPPAALAKSQADKVSLTALIARQRANITAGQALLGARPTDDPAAQVARQEQIRTDALAMLADAAEPRPDPNLARQLDNLSQTLMVLAVEQLRDVQATGQTGARLADALATERAILQRLVAADGRQDDALAEAARRAIAEMLAQIIARQKALHADSAGPVGTGAALSARQRALARELAMLNMLIDAEAKGGAGGNPALAEVYGKASQMLAARDVRGNMLIAADRLSNDAFDPAQATQQKVIDDLTAIHQLLLKQAMADAKKQILQSTQALEALGKRLDRMADVQASIVEVAKQLQKAKDLTEGEMLPAEHLQELEEARANMEEAIEQLAKDLHLLPDTSASNDLLAEMSEIFEDVKQAEGSEDSPVSEVAVDRDEGTLAGLKAMQEKMEERIGDLETWLKDTPDTDKWNQESFDRDELGEIPLGDLPDALEDIVGDLLEQAEDLAEQAQDSASNVALPDITMGWDIMDGPMPSWAAKGKSGNAPPNKNEQTGRSGAGREGASVGELAGDTIKALEGTETEVRRTNDAAQKGELKEEDPNFLQPKATGGGKMAGATYGEGMEGDTPPRNELKYRDLERRAMNIKRNTESVYSKAKMLRLPTGELDRALLEMDMANRRLSAGDLEGFMRDHERVVRQLRQTEAHLRGRPVAAGTGAAHRPDDVTGATKEPVPTQYEEAVAEYMRRIARQR